MKKPILIMLITFGMNVSAQVNFQDKKFTTVQETGFGVKKSLIFDIFDGKEKIIACRDFQDYMKEFSVSDSSINDKVISAFLSYKISMSIIDGQYQLKKRNSMDYIEGGKMLISIDKGNRLFLSIPIKAQNGYGNYLFGGIYYMDGETSVMFD